MSYFIKPERFCNAILGGEPKSSLLIKTKMANKKDQVKTLISKWINKDTFKNSRTNEPRTNGPRTIRFRTNGLRTNGPSK